VIIRNREVTFEQKTVICSAHGDITGGWRCVVVLLEIRVRVKKKDITCEVLRRNVSGITERCAYIG
jgi:hypothetical protein